MQKPIEIEIRILLNNRKKIEGELKKRGAKTVSFLKIKDHWYCYRNIKNYKDASIDKSGFALRIRELKDIYTGKKKTLLECKKLYDNKTHGLCNEYEINLENASQIKKILESIGLKEFLLVEKDRITYEYKNIKFCFEKIRGIGDGLEIETITRKDIKKTQKKLIALAQNLGIKPSEILEKSLTYIAMKKLSKF